MDISILTEKEITHCEIIVDAKPIGGFRLIDKNEADDKIIAVLNNDAVYDNYNDICHCPALIIERLKHYLLTYKDLPGEKRNCEITNVYGIEEAQETIRRAMDDYSNRFNSFEAMMKI